MDERTHWLAWAAGIIDGEGWIGLSSVSRGYRCLRIEVAQTDIRLPYKLKEIFMCGSVKPQRHNARRGWKPVWRWYVSGEDAANVLRLTLQWLVVKREQAEIAILSRQYVQRSGRKANVAAMHEVARQLTWLKANPKQESAGQSAPLAENKE